MGNAKPDILAAGGVVWRRTPSGVQVLLVHRPRYDDWSFPKGKHDPGENLLQTAVREVREETGVPVTIGASLGSIEYDVQGRHKSVRYWSMPVAPGASSATAPEDVDEVDGFAWLSPDQAQKRLSYSDDAAILRHWRDVGHSRIALLLVRHGRSGSRSEWSGPDVERPLDSKGRAQASQIAATLPFFHPGSVMCAGPTRCLQTVSPLAERLRTPVQVEESLSDEVSERRPNSSLASLRSYLHQKLPVVACSQGDTIEYALRQLLPERSDALRCKKGGLWAIGTVDDRIATADYYPSLLPPS